MKKENVVIKLPLDQRIVLDLEREADALGMKLNAYIQMVLGQHIMLLNQIEKKKESKG